jgi:hypothetical protein
MLAIQGFDGDWIEAIIVVIVLVGSALSALAKAIANKMRKPQAPDSVELDTESPEPMPARRRLPIPPVARPLSRPIERRVVVRTQTPQAASSQQEKRTEYEFEVALPEAVRPLVEMLLDKTADEAEERPKPAPPPPPRVSRPRPRRPRPDRPKLAQPGTPAVTEGEARLRDIAEREERQAQRLEKRIGHVETHVAPAVADADPQGRPDVAGLLDRRSLRRAIILNEVLGPPLALRGDS